MGYPLSQRTTSAKPKQTPRILLAFSSALRASLLSAVHSVLVRPQVLSTTPLLPYTLTAGRRCCCFLTQALFSNTYIYAFRNEANPPSPLRCQGLPITTPVLSNQSYRPKYGVSAGQIGTGAVNLYYHMQRRSRPPYPKPYTFLNSSNQQLDVHPIRPLVHILFNQEKCYHRLSAILCASCPSTISCLAIAYHSSVVNTYTGIQ